MTLSFIRYDSFAIRSFAHDGAHWFVLPDLCRALGIAAQEVAARLEDDKCMAIALRTAAGQQELALAVNVPGLHTVLSRGGRRSKARAFARWMTTQVLPSMAFDGGVVVPPRIGDGLTSTTEIADEVGHAPSTLGRLVGHLKAPEHGEFRPAVGHHSNSPVQQWWWNEEGRYAVLKECYWSHVLKAYAPDIRPN